MGENHRMIFLYDIKIAFILPAPIRRRIQNPRFTSTNSLDFLESTGRRMQPLGFTNTNSLIYRLQPEGISNSLPCTTLPCYNLLMNIYYHDMPLSHYHWSPPQSQFLWSKSHIMPLSYHLIIFTITMHSVTLFHVILIVTHLGRIWLITSLKVQKSKSPTII